MASNKCCITASFFVLVLSCLWMHTSHALTNRTADTIKPGQVLRFYETLVSEYGSFTLGFSNKGSSPCDIYLGIWSTDSPSTFVWVANGNTPLRGFDVNLTLDVDGILKIMNSTGGSTLLVLNSAHQAVAQNLTAALTEDGNFVLGDEWNPYDGPRRVLWQSFDYPTDTFLPGMTLGTNFKTGKKWLLTSWLSERVAGPGAFSLEWNGTSSGIGGQLVIKRRGDIYWASGKWDDPTGIVENFHSFSSEFYEYESNYITADSEWALSSEGKLYQLSTSSSPLVPSYICHEDASFPGCVAQNRPKCRRRGNAKLELHSGHFLTPSYLSDQNSSIGIADCEDRCWNDCFCGGFDTFESTNGTGCQFWSSDSIFNRDYRGSWREIYVYSSILDNGDKSHTDNTWWIWLIIVAVAVLASQLFLGFLYYLRRRKLEAEKKRTEEDILLELTTSSRFNDSKDTGNNEVRVFTFASIMAATNNFSSENKLGQGGFGPVYKGKLEEGQEVAVKRLSRGSGQGLVEFRNEIILIAKLQHMNLVRLLGCCIQGDEKMSIYEYMPNKSLDFFLFGLGVVERANYLGVKGFNAK